MLRPAQLVLLLTACSHVAPPPGSGMAPPGLTDASAVYEDLVTRTHSLARLDVLRDRPELRKQCTTLAHRLRWPSLPIHLLTVSSEFDGYVTAYGAAIHYRARCYRDVVFESGRLLAALSAVERWLERHEPPPPHDLRLVKEALGGLEESAAKMRAFVEAVERPLSFRECHHHERRSDLRQPEIHELRGRVSPAALGRLGAISWAIEGCGSDCSLAGLVQCDWADAQIAMAKTRLGQ